MAENNSEGGQKACSEEEYLKVQTHLKDEPATQKVGERKVLAQEEQGERQERVCGI